ncbi:MAG: RNA polymerase sigma factor [Caulobacterales bacterium]|uniref:RNA polymerase sigma factor n=1 Tax=Glycocaulis sp. TaxID=1969725 RepID=UPI003F9FBF93
MQSVYARLLNTARRHARLAHEAEDIVQDAMLAAFEAGRSDLDDPANRLWLNGVIRNQARMRARGAMRRKSREAVLAPETFADTERDRADMTLGAWVAGLPRALRPVAALVLTGHTRAEIRSALGLADTALRQRLQNLKRAAKASGIEAGALLALRPDLAHGVLRRGLLDVVSRRQATFATYDPDGNLLVFRTPALTKPAGTATR